MGQRSHREGEQVKRTIITLAAVIGLLAAGSSPALATIDMPDKVTLCHNGNTITIAWVAAYGPRGHFYWPGNGPREGHNGDTLGECPVPEPTPTPTPEPTAEPRDCVGDECEPTPTPEPTATPEPTVAPTPTPVPSESATPTASPSVAPSPSDVPTAKPTPKPTNPPTDTVGSTTQTGGGIAPLLLLLAGISGASLLLARKRA